MSQERLLAALEQGARLCLAPLSAMGGGPWEASDSLAGEAAARRLQALVEEPTLEDCHGVWLTARSAAFLAFFPRRCALWLTERFTRGHAERIDALVTRDLQGVAEIANIVVNAFIVPLAEALDQDLVLSGPETMLERRHELLARALARRPGLEDLGPAGFVRLTNGGRQEFFLAVFLASDAAERLSRP